MNIKYDICAQTDIGSVRAENEDNLSINNKYIRSFERGNWEAQTVVDECVVTVCDGMGGESFGEFASGCAVSNIAGCYEDILSTRGTDQVEMVNALILKINQQICDEMSKQNTRIGSTIAMLCIKNGEADIYNIGDSRIYLFRNETLKKLSRDHTIAQQKYDIGAITAEQIEHDPGKHKLTQHLGIFENEMIIEAHHENIQIQPDDIFLLCSDGLTDMVSDSNIQQILSESKNPDSAVSKLVETALENGGKDNVSVIIVQAKKGD